MNVQDLMAADPFGKAERLEAAKKEKLARLGANSQQEDLSNTHTVLDNGLIESNANKIWNDYGASDIQGMVGDAVANKQVFRRPDGSMFQRGPNMEEVPFRGDAERFYAYGTTANEDEVKFGIARGDLPSSDYRYVPGLAEKEGYSVGKKGYGWAPGEGGVDISKKHLDVLLPRDIAVGLEAAIHGRKDALESRKYKDIMAPEAIKASGTSEYYNSMEGALGNANTDTRPQTASLADVTSKVPELKIQGRTKEQQAQLDALASGALTVDHKYTPTERVANAGKAVAFRALEGVANTIDLAPEAVEYLYKNATGKDTEWSDVKGLFEEKEEKALKSFIGYKDKSMQKAAEEAKQAAMDAYENEDWWGVLKAVGNGLTTPEVAGESAGFIIGMLLPGGIATKGLRATSGVAKEAKVIQAAAQASGTKMKLADAVKLAEEGADLGYRLTKKLAGQSGQIGYAEQVAREADTEYKKLYGEEQSAERRMGSFLLGLVSANMDATMGKLVMAGKDPMAQAVRAALLRATPKQGAGFVKTLAASTGIATSRIIGAMAEEGFTEGVQSSLELTAERYKDGTLGGMSGKEIAGRIGSEAILGAAGGAQFAGPSTTKQFLFGKKKEAAIPTIDEVEQAFTTGVNVVDNLIKGEDVEGEATGEFIGFDTSVTYDADVVKPVIEAMLLKPKESYTKDEQDFFRSNKDTFEAVAAEGYEKLKIARGQQAADVQAEVEENSAILNWATTGEGEMPAPTSTIKQETLDRVQSIYDNDALTEDEKAIEIDQIPELKGIASKAVILGEAGSAATIEDKVTKANEIRTAMLRSGTTKEEADVVSRLVFSLGAGVGIDLQWKDDTKEQLEGAVDAQQAEGGPGAKVVTVERVLRKGTVADQTVEETRDGMPVAAFSDAQVMAIATGNVDALGDVVSTSSKLTTSLNRLREFSSSRVGKQAREQINKVATAISDVAEKSGIAFVDNAKSPEAKQAAAFRVAVVALNQIHSALVSSTHEALRDDMTTMPQGAALYKVAAQIGKDLVHSYGLNFRGADATVAEAYTKLGLQSLKLVKDAGLVEEIDNDVVPESRNLKTATGDKVKAAQVGLKEITSVDVNNDAIMVGKSVKLADLNHEDKSPKGVAAGSEMANALKLLKPILMLGNRELPAKSPSSERARTDKPKGFSTKDRLNPETGEVEKFSESQDTIDKLNNTPLKIKGSMVTLLKLIRDEYENALAQKETTSIMEFINKREWLRDSLGIKDTSAIKGSFLEDSIEAANWAKADALRNVLDNLDDLVPSDNNPSGELYFTYKGDSNDRISLTNTVLNFQHDKVFSRNLITATEKSTTENKKEFDFLVTEIADESKLSVDEILNSGVNKRLDTLIAALTIYNKESKWLPGVVEDTNPLEAIAAEMKPGGLFANARSGFKVMSLVEAISDIRNRDGYKVETEYMAGADARASGVMNTLANLLGRNTKNSWVANTKKLLGFFGIQFKDEKVPASDPYMALIKKMMDNENVQGVTIEEQMSASKLGQLASRVGIKLREFAKPPIMVWFYGKNSEGIKQTIGDTIALEVFKSVIGFDGKAVNKELAAEVAELLEVDVKALKKMTNEQFKVLAKYYENEYADEMVKTLDKMYPQVVEYRNEMKRIYDLLTGTLDNWKGEFPSAVATMFGETGGDIKTFKDRDVILQDASEDTGWLPLFAHRAMPNATSLPVNPQHSQDAAQLLWTVSKLLASGSGKGGLLTVHDNIMGSVKAVMESQEIYNESYLRSALEYDYMRKAVELVRGLQAQLDKTTEHGLKQFNEIDRVIGPIEEKNKEAFEIKKELLEDAKAEMFGTREEDIIDTDSVDTVVTEPVVVEATTPVVNEAKPNVTQVLGRIRSNATTVKELVQGLVGNAELLGIDSMVDMLQDAMSKLKNGVILVKGQKFAYDYTDGKRTITIDRRTKVSAKEMAEFLAHEIEHDLTATYIKTNPNAGEVVYLGKVVDALVDKTKNKTVSDRIGYILSRDSKVDQVMELVAVLRSEDAAATEIANLLFKEKSESFISRLLETVKSLVRKAWKGDEPITFENTAAALEQVRQYVDMQGKATAEAKAETKVKDGTIQAKAEEEINNSALPEEAKQDMLEKLAGCM